MTPQRASLLIVDDDELARGLLRRFLTPHGFDITEVEDGSAALSLLRNQRFDLVLLDVEMPGLCGLEVLKDLRKTHSAADLPVMMATVLDATDDIVTALNLGANDYVAKPLNLPVVLARARTLIALKRVNAELAQANGRMRQELEAAARLQQALLPAEKPRIPGVAFDWRYQPCTELAGDLLGLVPIDGRVWLYVLDVVGHGVKAALLAVTVHRVLSRLLAHRPLLTPAAVAAQLNREFPFTMRTQQFFSLMLAVLDPGAGTFHYVSAAHPGPIQLLSGRAAPPLPLASPLVGLGSDGDYVDHVLPVGAGDRLYLYSDGLFEAMNAAEQQFSEARCAALLAEVRRLTLAASVDRLLDAVKQWTAPKSPHDDISLIAVELG